MSVDVTPVESAFALAVEADEVKSGVDFRRRLLKRSTFLIGAGILLFWVLAAVIGQRVAGSPYTENMLAINAAPSGAHWFGTDQLGRDMFARVIAGSRDILIIAPLGTLIGTLVGTALGLVMGYYHGIVDDVLSRLIEAFMALPLVVTGILGVLALGASNLTMILVIGIVFAPLIARTVRAAVLTERDLDYVPAAQLRGESAAHIMGAEILPNVLAPIMVEFTVRLGYAVFTLVTLSFLGFGLQPPSPNWGADISTNYALITAGDWWEVLFDAIAIASLVIGINMVANAIEATLDEP